MYYYTFVEYDNGTEAANLFDCNSLKSAENWIKVFSKMFEKDGVKAIKKELMEREGEFPHRIVDW